MIKNMFGLFKNKISHREVVNQYDNSDLIKAYNLIKESVPEYKEPNYALAEKVFKDFNSFQLKLFNEHLPLHPLMTLVPMSLLPYPKKYIKAAYYLYIDLANQNAPDMVQNIQELGFWLFNGYPSYEKYIAKIESIGKSDPTGGILIREKFEKLFGSKEISKEDYLAGTGSQDCSDEKIEYDFGYLPDIEEDVDFEKISKEVQKSYGKQEDEEYKIKELNSSDISTESKIIWEKDNDIKNIPNNVLIKTDTVFQIPPTDGKINIANSKESFKIIFFEEEDINKSDFVSKNTNIAEAQVHYLINDSTIYKMFKSIDKDLNNLCFTQSQILVFLKEHRNKLVGTWHFMYKIEDNFMFMQVCMDNDGSMRLFGGDFTPEGLDHVYKAAGVSFRFLTPKN